MFYLPFNKLFKRTFSIKISRNCIVKNHDSVNHWSKRPSLFESTKKIFMGIPINPKSTLNMHEDSSLFDYHFQQEVISSHLPRYSPWKDSFVIMVKTGACGSLLRRIRVSWQHITNQYKSGAPNMALGGTATSLVLIDFCKKVTTAQKVEMYQRWVEAIKDWDSENPEVRWGRVTPKMVHNMKYHAAFIPWNPVVDSWQGAALTNDTDGYIKLMARDRLSATWKSIVREMYTPEKSVRKLVRGTEWRLFGKEFLLTYHGFNTRPQTIFETIQKSLKKKRLMYDRILVRTVADSTAYPIRITLKNPCHIRDPFLCENFLPIIPFSNTRVNFEKLIRLFGSGRFWTNRDPLRINKPIREPGYWLTYDISLGLNRYWERIFWKRPFVTWPNPRNRDLRLTDESTNFWGDKDCISMDAVKKKRALESRRYRMKKSKTS